MRGPIGGRIVSILAVAALVLFVGGFPGLAGTAGHEHGRPGLYDPGCPLAALATVDRHDDVVVAAAAAVLLVPVAALAAIALVEVSPAAPAADVRFRAPPRR